MAEGFTVVPAEQAATIKVGTQAAWKGRLIAGDMLEMAQRPNWTKDDVARTGYKMRTKQFDSEGEKRFYVWLEQATAEENVSIIVGHTPPFVSEDASDPAVGADDDMPVPL